MQPTKTTPGRVSAKRQRPKIILRVNSAPAASRAKRGGILQRFVAD